MKGRLNFLLDPELKRLGEQLAERLKTIAGEVEPAQYRAWAAPILRGLLNSTFREVGATEGALWLADTAHENLVPVYSNGANAEHFLDTVSQPLSSGLISMVFATQQPFCENEVYKNERHAARVDQLMGQVTCAMIAVPVFFAEDVRGVISCVRTKAPDATGPDPPGFGIEDMQQIELAAEIARRLVEHRLIATSVGWTHGG